MAEGNEYQPEDTDCFFFQYMTHCEEEQCRFLHRESCKLSKDVCPVWHQQRRCTNNACPQKHLNQETLKQYFLCDQENLNNQCTQQNCRMYHEKVSIFDGFYHSANEVPVLAEERRNECNNFMERNFLQTQICMKSASQFLKIAVKFIQRAVQDKKLSGDRGKQYIKEILHTILFLCHINLPSFEPQDLLQESWECWYHKLPDVFKQYETHLPTRPPYTILLEIVVDCKESDNTEEILALLSILNKKMTVEQNSQKGRRCGNNLCFVSTVISCCFFQDLVRGTKTNNYLGASVSCFGKHQKEIMIDILCCQTWNKDISLAVCMALECHEQAIKFHPLVHCTAYSMKDSSNTERGVCTANGKHQQHTPIPPCRKCLTLFPDIGNDLQQRNNDHRFWQYGNCAEVESLSRLLNAHGDISMRLSAPAGERFRWESLILKRKRRLIHNLKLFKFHLGNDLLFYRPFEQQNTA
ncbi:uncharacterized protein [Heterodontus francisci]|uniref:uncharacterized protein n=1 Tax=Heterodontus francisci TaxID=7792 RepID=UPI00355C8F6E